MDEISRSVATTRLLEDFVRQVSDEVVVPPLSADRRAPLFRAAPTGGPRRVVATVLVAAVVVGAIVLALAYGPRSTDHGSGLANQPTGSRWTLVGGPARWQREFLAPNVANYGGPDTISCPPGTITTCYVTVNTIPLGAKPLTSAAYRTSDSGSYWSWLFLPGHTWLSSAFSCLDAHTCAVGADVQFEPATAPDTSGRAAILTTDDAGRRWTVRRLPSAYGLVTDLSCPTVSHCVAVAWQRGADPLPNPQSGFDRYYPSTVLLTNNGGRSWSKATLPPTSSPSVRYALGSDGGASLTCPTVRICDVTGEQADIVTTDGGYVQQDTRSVVLMSDNGGRSWTLTHETPAGAPGNLGLACAGASKCWMFASTGQDPTGSYGLFTSDDGGRRWSALPATGLPRPAAAELTSITCPTVDHCLLTEIGSNPAKEAILSSSDGGRHWQPEALPAAPPGETQEGIAGLSCRPSGSCLALVDDLLPPPSSAMVDRLLTNSPAARPTGHG